MPYRKSNTPCEEIGRLLKGYDITATRLTKMLGISMNTARKKLSNPKEFRIGELLDICRKGHIPVEELRMNIKG